MSLSRKFAIGIVMIVPAFVTGGIVWSILESWIAVIIWEIFVAFIYGGIVKGKLSFGSKAA
ncbi:MAG: hypothetical protein JRH08_08795 [Deltaproteobacteria bacterium]|nr:hypothetical protein [Deltaproteobacteria bacterium]MBW1930090.1 hypothetical protein [Deltaproteobacteria bacterium]MBW2026224.1 hypothetical protein [Deltaproteobacteria bacterium]MBW2125777.1 hypothetical protein [Deltaproteobacteria bacterium]RLB18290.1 MAG: hypothetical protein DRG63_02625 [Deltaproteobacteria bacterium]